MREDVSYIEMEGPPWRPPRERRAAPCFREGEAQMGGSIRVQCLGCMRGR